MKVRWGRLALFFILVVAILSTIALTTRDILNNLTLGLDLRGGFEVLYEAQPLEKGQKITPQVLADTAQALQNRIDVLGVTEPELSVEPPNRIRVQLAGVPDQEEARRVLGTPAKLTFRDESGKVLLTGQDLKEGGAAQDYDETGQPAVRLKLKDSEKFAKITRENVGRIMAIYLDENELSAPVIREPIPSGEAVISGNFTVEEAKELADLLNAGALPVKLVEKQSYAVDASLGTLSLQQSLEAGLYGTLAIFLFIIGYYRLPGLVASISLIAYAYLVLLTFVLLDVTLTLPGIAAFILGIGMAVDANILMYERIKEEMRLGKSIPVSVKAGSRRSFLTIFDANITTVLAAVVLFYFGTAGVRGFAVSLIFSIAVSFLTAVALSRILLNLLVRANAVKRPWLFGVKEDEIGEL
ncbi:MAG: protein translocase subunit SecD [Planifilum sp.]|jgi:preprotein translocase subunit SecD